MTPAGSATRRGEPPGHARVDLAAVRRVAHEQSLRVTPGIDDIETYAGSQNGDDSHREILGPLLAGGGAHGLVVLDGRVVAQWGDPDRPEMLFSGTKSVVSLVAGLAADDGLLELDAPVADQVDLDLFHLAPADRITWRHLLEQTSNWDGELWGKPAAADAQSRRPGSAPPGSPPGAGFAYNDVRVNLLCLALTSLWRRPLPDVLGERVMEPLGASRTWRWHGYRDATVTVPDGQELAVVSGGAHWGGGLFLDARDLALIGELYRLEGRWGGRRVVSAEWIARSWTPSRENPDYGLLWWLNDREAVSRHAAPTGRAARGNGARHLLWVDPARRLTVVSRWGEQVHTLLREITDLVSPPGSR